MRARRDAGGSGWLALLILLAGIALFETLGRDAAGADARQPPTAGTAAPARDGSAAR
ncbi:MAG: hypothetical protein O9284_01285 [Steroidobacteraceae bacterium]|jgi:hypothetical protein|nr:hypothetical protein [Steroidobacteraceae bacterium]